MAQVFERSLIRMGDGGLVVTLPPGWLRFNQLKAGDRVEVVTNGKVIIRPVAKNQKAVADGK